MCNSGRSSADFECIYGMKRPPPYPVLPIAAGFDGRERWTLIHLSRGFCGHLAASVELFDYTSFDREVRWLRHHY